MPIGVPVVLMTKVLLIDDQQFVADLVQAMLEGEKDTEFYYCQHAIKAIEMAEEVRPTIILQDLVMPNVDGLQLIQKLRSAPATRDIPLIVLSAEESAITKAESFARGANDYMVKLPDRVELLARVRYHSEAYRRLLERNQAYYQLERSQAALIHELQEAASYVRSLLPPCWDTGPIKAHWEFIPSEQLGGDAFGYYWVDKEHLAMFLLDVCGHGIGAALLSISIMNDLRSSTLPNVNFTSPKAVLEALNTAFPMEQHNNMFFTIWYGVYNSVHHKLRYSCGGHPPALLVRRMDTQELKIFSLKTPGIVLGAMTDSHYVEEVVDIQSGDELYLYSDGVYEIEQANGAAMPLADFIEIVKRSAGNSDALKRILAEVQSRSNTPSFVDDASLVRFVIE